MANELLGVAELTSQLAELASPKDTARIIRGSLIPSMNRVKKLAKANLSAISPGRAQIHKTYKGRYVTAGFALRSLRVVVRANREKTKFSAVLGVAREAFYVVQFFELGTSKLAKQPWLVPAFEASKSGALTLLVETLRKRVAKVAAKKGRTA